MRIIGGIYKGRQIPADHRLALRPTTDFAKEGMFNILSNRYDFEGIDVLDLFSGTGSISYEFVSRGANVHSVEMAPRHAMYIRNTAKQLGLTKMRVIRDDVFHFLGICKGNYDIIFADPPYEMEKIAEIPDALLNRNLLKPNGIFVMEHSRRTDFSAHPHLIECRHYGNVHFSFFNATR
jgi:16S rRNA (guanine(966)-N(2))-methyltransferase RsmD